MKFKNIIDKLLRGESISSEERSTLLEFRDPDPRDSQSDPASGDNSGSRKNAPESSPRFENRPAIDKDARIAELEEKIDELEGRGKSELEKLQSDYRKLETKLKNAEAERDSARAERDSLVYDGAISNLAAEHRFLNRDFLKYKFQSAKIDPSDTDAAKKFMESLKQSEPGFFGAELNPGGAGSGGGSAPADGAAAGNRARIDELLKKDVLSFAEVAEIKKLQSEIDAAAGDDHK